ncbi:MAG: hypothetical protein ACRD3K_04185 [Edaphobacter sp.]
MALDREKMQENLAPARSVHLLVEMLVVTGLAAGRENTEVFTLLGHPNPHPEVDPVHRTQRNPIAAAWVAVKSNANSRTRRRNRASLNLEQR